MGAKLVCRYNGRDFTTADMALLHTLLAIKPPLSRHALSREWCQRIGWLTPGGGLKDMSARLAMLAMQRDGLLTLPPPRRPQSRPKPIVFGPETDPPEQPITASLDVVRPPANCPCREWHRRQCALERLPRTLSLSRLQSAQRRPVALRRVGPCGPSARPARVRRCRLENRAPRCVHRLVIGTAATPSALGGEQLPLPDIALGQAAQSRLSHPVPNTAAFAPRLATTLCLPTCVTGNFL